MNTAYAEFLFQNEGFSKMRTGGGCMAWHKQVTGPRGTFHALATDEDGNLPSQFEIVGGVYNNDEECGGWEGEAIHYDRYENALDCAADLINALNYYAGLE